jgi:hypothetical protein
MDEYMKQVSYKSRKFSMAYVTNTNFYAFTHNQVHLRESLIWMFLFAFCSVGARVCFICAVVVNKMQAEQTLVAS